MPSYWKLRTEGLDAAHSQRVKPTLSLSRVPAALGSLLFANNFSAVWSRRLSKGAIVTKSLNRLWHGIAEIPLLDILIRRLH
jgi:hypothetical protein